jgi:hypothetical protein
MSQQITADYLRSILNQTPNTQENQSVIAALQQAIKDASVWRKPFTYATSFLALAAASTVTNNIAIQADADFLILAQTYAADVAAAGQTVQTATNPLANVLLINTGTGENLMNQALPVTDIFGSGQFPFILPQPILLPARSNLAVQVNNRDAAQTYNLFLNFIGVKLYSA